MAIQDTFPNLPGFVAQIQDTNLRVKQPPQTLAQSVLLLGVGTDGPSNTPIQIQSLADAERLYGIISPATSISQNGLVQKGLTRGATEAFQAGCTDLRLVRVGGVSASITLTDTTTANNITLTENYPGVKYNGLKASVTVPSGTGTLDGAVTITTLDAVTHTVNFGDATLVGDLINAINALNINVTASAGTTAVLTATTGLTAKATTAFSGGDDGTGVTDAQYSDNLTAAYKLLENYGTDIVVPLGAYLQPTKVYTSTSTSTTSANGGDTVFFGQNLAQFIARTSVRTKSCFGIISIVPLSNPSFAAVQLWALSLQSANYTFQYQSDYAPSAGPLPGTVNDPSTGAPFDMGYLLNIIAGPDLILRSGRMGVYTMDGAATYAGRICSLVPQSATTNKPIGPALGLAYELGPSIHNNLVAARVVSFINSQGAVRTVADQTYSVATNDFTKLSTLRVTYAVVEAVRQACMPFIGEANNPANLNSMGTAIEGVLKTFKDAGALLDGDYGLNATASDQINGNLTVDLSLVPALQIRKITLTVSLQPAGTN